MLKKLRNPDSKEFKGIRTRFRTIFKPGIKYETRIFYDTESADNTSGFVLLIYVEEKFLVEMKRLLVKQFGVDPIWEGYCLGVTIR